MFSNPGRSLQDWRVERFFKDLYKIFEDNECDALWDLGDTMDDRSMIPVAALDTTLTGLQLFPDGNHLKLTGNHEQVLKDTTISNSKVFDPYFYVADQPYSYVEKRTKTRILLCPFPASNKELEKWIDAQRKTAKDYKQTILLGHFQAIGSETKSGIMLEGVDITCMDWVDQAFLGHVHKPQSLADNIHYVGSPFQQNWGESAENKRVAIYDTATQVMEWIFMEDQGFKYPQYRAVTLSTFESSIEEESEDRWKVLLTSPDETDRFYQHPLSNRAEAVYNYDIAPTTANAIEGADTWDFDSILVRFLERNPPENSDITFTKDEMLELAGEITGRN